MSTFGSNMTDAIKRRLENDKAHQDQMKKDPSMYQKAKDVLGYGKKPEEKEEES